MVKRSGCILLRWLPAASTPWLRSAVKAGRPRAWYGVLALPLWLLSPDYSFAQNQSTATITGTIADSSGALVPGAEIDVKSLATQVVVKVKTNNAGSYNVPGLQPGHYAVTITHDGFQTVERTNIDVELDQTARVDARLTTGESQQIVTVNTTTPLLETDNTQVETVFSTELTQNLPLVGRVPTSLATLAPGTSTVQSQQIGVGTGGSIDPGRVNVAGSRSFTLDAVLDGGTVNLPAGNNFGNMIPSLGAISEFSVVQNNFGAQFGSGTSVLNMIIKSGTSQFHGLAFEYLENDALDATQIFAQSKPKLRYNQFGGAIGGPILRGKLFFFFAYQNTLVPSSVNSIITVPTTAVTTGDFSAFNIPLIDPTTGKQFPGNKIPQSRIDAVAAKAQTYWPAPNCGGPGATANNYCRLVPTNPQTPIYDGRIDWTINAAHQLSYSTHQEPYTSQNSGLIPGPACYGGESCGQAGQYDQVNQVAERWIVTPSAFNAAYVTFVREHYDNGSPSFGGNFPSKLGLSANNISQLYFPSFTINGAVTTSLGPGSYYAGTTNNFIYSDVFTWVRGKHTLNFGGQFNKQQINDAATYGAPSFAFNGQFTGIGYADFLLGKVYSYGYSAQPIGFAGRRQPFAAFVQDDWKVLPNVTINLGLRYQHEGPYTEAHNRTANFSPTAINPATQTPGAIVYASSAQPNIQQGHNALFAPRIGFAVSLPSETVVRGAYGIFYIPIVSGSGFNSNPPGYNISQSLISLTPQSPAVFQLSQGPPAYVVPTAADRNGAISNGTGITWYPYDSRQQYLQQWHLSVQKQLGSQTTAEISYVGARGLHLVFPRDANQVPFGELGSPEDRTDPQQLRPFPQYQSITAQYNDGFSNYNALEVKIQRRFSQGFTFLANYTYAKSIDNSSLDTTTQIGNEYQISARPDLNRAASDYDLTHRGVIAYVYDLPVGQGRRFMSRGGLLNAVLGGWTNSGSFNANTGSPFTVYAASPNLTGSLAGNVFANSTGDKNGPKTAAQWFNTAVFSSPAPYTFGDSGRNSVRGPGAWDLDLALMKTFPLWEFAKLQVRADAFNALNHANLLLPNATLGSAAFGTITSGSPPRVVQVGAQITF